MIVEAPELLRVDWMSVGEKIVPQERRESFLEDCRAMRWQSVPTDMSMMSGLAVKEVIEQLRIPRVDMVAESNALAPYGLFAIQGHYTNGRMRAYFADMGDKCSAIVVELFEETTKGGTL